MAAVDASGLVRFPCPVDALRVGDLVLTPARRWETVTALNPGQVFSRSTRVVTDATGPDFPWEWVNRHTVIVRRRPASPLSLVVVAA